MIAVAESVTHLNLLAADIRKLTHKMEVGRDKVPSWPADKLVVHAEHSNLFYDIITDKIVEQVSF